MTAFRIALSLFQLASAVVMVALARRLRRDRLQLRGLIDRYGPRPLLSNPDGFGSRCPVVAECDRYDGHDGPHSWEP